MRGEKGRGQAPEIFWPKAAPVTNTAVISTTTAIYSRAFAVIICRRLSHSFVVVVVVVVLENAASGYQCIYTIVSVT